MYMFDEKSILGLHPRSLIDTEVAQNARTFARQAPSDSG